MKKVFAKSLLVAAMFSVAGSALMNPLMIFIKIIKLR